MSETTHDLPAMLRLAVDAWPALDTADIEGWSWRASGGGSKRANSVSALKFIGDDVSAAIDEVEARYRTIGQQVRFQIDAISTPANLADRLGARGYVVEEGTLTMAKAVGAELPGDAAAAGCEVTASASPEWLSVYLSAITADRRAVNQRILPLVPHPRAFFLHRRQGQPVSSGLCVVSGGAAIVECMATTAVARRAGGARAVLYAIEAWATRQGAETLFLQVVDTNAPAVALYERAGYRRIAATRYLVRD